MFDETPVGVLFDVSIQFFIALDFLFPKHNEAVLKIWFCFTNFKNYHAINLILPLVINMNWSDLKHFNKQNIVARDMVANMYKVLYHVLFFLVVSNEWLFLECVKWVAISTKSQMGGYFYKVSNGCIFLQSVKWVHMSTKCQMDGYL